MNTRHVKYRLVGWLVRLCDLRPLDLYITDTKLIKNNNQKMEYQPDKLTVTNYFGGRLLGPILNPGTLTEMCEASRHICHVI